jgi:negative elongation factor C/D
MNIFLSSYFRHGGAPDQVIELLSDNYMAIAQTATLMADWLISTGVEPSDVVNMIVQHLQTLIEKHFEPKKADSIFEAGGVSFGLFYLGESLHINLGSIMVN